MGQATGVCKLIALFFGLVMVAAACGGDDATEDSSSTDTEETTAVEESDSDSDEGAEDADSDGTEEGTDEGTEEQASPNGVFRFSAELAPPGWDPHLDGRNAVMTYYQAVYDGLVNTAPDGSIVEGLATEWEISATEARFTLREGVTFHDGTPFDAEAVKYNVEKVQSNPGINALVLGTIDEVVVESPTEVTFALSQPDPDLLTNLGLMPGLMLSPNVAPEDVAAGTPAGTGPYMLESNTEDRVVLTPNPDFWDPSQQGLEGIEYITLPDDSARINALTTGEADAVTLRAGQVAAAEDAGFAIAETLANVMVFVVSDVGGETLPELGDERVRQALAHAIDRDVWTEAVNQGRGAPADQLFASDSPFYVDDFEGFEYDPERSKELLEEAGVTDLVIPTAAWGPFSVGAQVLQQFFADIGVTLEISETAPGGDVAAIQSFESLVGQAPTPDAHPDQVYGRYFAPTAPANPSGATIDGLDDARDAAAAATDEAASAEGYHEMLDLAYGGAWIVPIHTNPSIVAYDAESYPSLEGLERRVLGVNLRELTLAD